MADESKTERATPERRRKAREQGGVARSREFPGVLAMAGIVGAIMLLAPEAAEHWTKLYRELLDSAVREGIEPNGPALYWSALEVLRWMAPVLLAGFALALGAQWAQGGITIAPAALAIKPERMSPGSRLGQIFSVTGLNNLLKSLLPFSVMAWVGVSTLSAQWPAMVHASAVSPRMFASFLGGIALTIGWKCGLVLLLWSAVDYGLTWRKMESDLKMSRQDLKDEMKQTDGNPVVKARVRRIRNQMRRRRALKATATATVVVTNPTHYAVALRYEPAMAAPIVVAKGLDLLAQQIKALAVEHGIPMMENRPLAQALYKSVEEGDAIPAALYQAVADILVVVFRAQAEVRTQEAARRSRNASGGRI